MEAREGMCIANILAGMVEDTAASCSEHAIGHSLGSKHPKTPHGAALSLVCVECFRYYSRWVPERMAEMAEAVGYPKTAEAFIQFLEDLLKKVGLYQLDYTQWGIDPARAEEYARNSFDATQYLHDGDVHMMTLEECTEVIRKSLER